MWLLSRLSLVSGLAPWLLGAGGFAALTVVLTRWPRRRWWAAPVAFVASVALLVGVSSSWQLPRRLHGTWPRTFFVWCALPLVALVATAVSWRHARIRHHVAGFLAIVLLAGFAADRVDAFYGAVPTVGDLLGVPLPGEISGPLRLASAGTGPTLPATGVVFPITIPGITSHFQARTGYVWLPPIWFSRPRPRLPALELITGAPGVLDLWLRGAHAVRTLNAYADSHHGWGPIVVVADPNGSLLGDTECVNGPRGRADTYMSVDVIRFIDQRFGVLAGPRSWAVAGYSAGGTCALVLALRHPATYAAFGDFSGDPRPTLGSWPATLAGLFGGSVVRAQMYDPSWLLRHERVPGLLAWFETGQHDAAFRLTAMRQLAALARRAGAHAVVVSRPGTHSLYFWSHCLQSAVPALLAAAAHAAPRTEAGHGTPPRVDATALLR